jgi:hypothetical protein
MYRGRILKTPCKGCKDVASFSFEGCMKKCPTFLKHLKVVFSKKISPCRDLRCGVPIVSPRNREKCKEGCPLPKIFAKILENDGEGVACVLGKKKDDRAAPYLRSWEC